MDRWDFQGIPGNEPINNPAGSGTAQTIASRWSATSTDFRTGPGKNYQHREVSVEQNRDAV
jgi:hypothetical protein